MKPSLLLFLFDLYFCFSIAASSAAAEISSDAMDGSRIVESIIVDGNPRTRDIVILRELDFQVGDSLDHAVLEESRQRLRNLRIFSSIIFRLEESVSNKIRLIIEVQERWTAIPIAKFGSAGGTRFFTLGAFDINLFGRGLELGAQYDNLNGRDGFVTWFRNPRLFDQRLLIGYDIWLTSRNRELFKQNGDRESAFTFEKSRVHVFFERELNRTWSVGAGFDYVDHKVSDKSLSGRQLNLNRTANFSLPPSSQQLALEFSARVGRLNHDNYIVEGLQSEWLYRIAVEALGSTESSQQWTIENRAFFRVLDRHNVGFALSLGHTSAKLLQDQFYLGGLAEIRGFRDGQFVGSDFWKANLEYRLPSFTSSWLVLQHVAFIDVGNAGNSIRETFENPVLSGLGIGLRLISPKIFRLNVRVDYARTFGRESRGAFSFGLQQFF